MHGLDVCTPNHHTREASFISQGPCFDSGALLNEYLIGTAWKVLLDWGTGWNREEEASLVDELNEFGIWIRIKDFENLTTKSFNLYVEWGFTQPPL